jgi:hypothetical protein
MDAIYTAAALIHMDTSWTSHTQQQQQHGYTWIHHGYYIHISNKSMDTHVYIMDTTYTAATAAWMHMGTSWILHTQQQQHGYIWIYNGYYIHSSSMDTHGYNMNTTYTAATTAWIYKNT